MQTVPTNRLPNLGIGTDIESIARFRRGTIVQGSSFLSRVYTESELSYCFSQRAVAPHLAARYAGKEAVVKALASQGRTTVTYKDIQILNDENGVPVVTIGAAGFDDLQIYLSLSHCKDKAIAFAVVVQVTRGEEGREGVFQGG